MAREKPAQARFTRHFSKAQKDAFLHAVIIDGLPIAEARRQARDGGLGVPAFSIGTYAYKLVERNRETYERTDDQALDRAAKHELRQAENDALAALRNIRRQAKTAGAVDVVALAKAAKALAAIRQARRTSEAIDTPGQSSKITRAIDGSNQTPRAGDVLATLLENATPTKRETTRRHKIGDANDATDQSAAQGEKSGSVVGARDGAEPKAALAA